MKIDGIRAQNIYETYQKDLERTEAGKPNPGTADTAKASAESGMSRDVIEISSQAADLKEAGMFAKKAMGESGGGKAARLAELKNLIDTGNYQVPSEEVAKSILKGIRLDLRA
jgi:flagellar biosynthesis anti-sigma factor FlgM